MFGGHHHHHHHHGHHQPQVVYVAQPQPQVVYAAPPAQVVYGAPPPVYGAPVYAAPAVPMMPGGMQVVGTGRRVALFNSHSNLYLTAEHGTLTAHHDIHHHSHWFGKDRSHKAHFHVEQHGPLQSIRTAHHQYIAVNSLGAVYLACSPMERDAMFSVEYHPEHHGKLAFRSVHGRYLGIRNHQVIAWHEFTPHELFSEVPV